MGIISAAVDRLLHTTVTRAADRPVPAALELHRETPVIDLVVGSALFRRDIASPGRRGHVDLGRLRAGGVRIIGLTVATRFPDLRGSLSRFHFRSLGAPPGAMSSNMALAEWLIARIHSWCEARPGELRLLRGTGDLDDCLRPAGPIGVFIGVQGAHVLDGRLENLARLRELGVLMFAPAHVMDNAFAGSSTGKQRDGLSPLGRELITELEARGLLIDLAHMSLAGIEQSLELCSRPPVISHAGLLSQHGAAGRWRRYSPATRNVPDWAAQAVGRAGGLIGLVLSTQLLGGSSIEDFVGAARRAIDLAGPGGVALGSDMDGGLRMVVDAAGLPRLTDGLLAGGIPPEHARGLLGLNALRLLRPPLGGPAGDHRPTTNQSTSG